MRRSLALALLGAQAASGYIYKLSHNTGSSVASGDGTYAQSALVLSEVNTPVLSRRGRRARAPAAAAVGAGCGWCTGL